jgi:hypothetical protein
VKPTFQEFPKIPRLNRTITITEKIDGTNAQVVVTEDGEVYAGSRNRYIEPGKNTDNAGFAAWVKENEDELRTKLGIGVHYGEWYGAGIGRKYGLGTKRFALFNTDRWSDPDVRPSCCEVVPRLWVGTFSEQAIVDAINKLKSEGSVAVPGWMKPEGVVVFMHSSGTCYKVLCENDEPPKGVTTRLERAVAEERSQ